MNARCVLHSIPLAIMFLISPVAPCMGADEQSSHECLQFAQGVQSCPVTFFELSSEPQRYEGKTVSIIGFLGIDARRLFLYPSKDSYDYADNAASIMLDIEFGDASKLATSHTSRYVQLVGTFSARRLGDRYGIRIGAIRPAKGPVVREPRIRDESSSTIDFDVDFPEEAGGKD